MMKEEVRHADNEKIDLKVWKRLVDYGLQYKARVIRTILVLLVVSGADLAYPLFTRYAINHFIVGETTQGLPLFGALYIFTVVAQGICVMLFAVILLIIVSSVLTPIILKLLYAKDKPEASLAQA